MSEKLLVCVRVRVCECASLYIRVSVEMYVLFLLSLDFLSHVIAWAKWEKTTQRTWFRREKKNALAIFLSLSLFLAIFFFSSSFSLVVVGCC